MYIFLTILCGLLIAYLFYHKMTNKMCNCKTRMDDKVVIVTGANSGIGYETAEDLAGRGAKVILACRDVNKGTAAVDKIKETTGNQNVIIKPLDLASLKSVRAFADDIIKTEPKLDVLINNAGTGKLDNSLTEDNIVIEAQVNHFSPFLLTMLLVPALQRSAPSRIVNIGSALHRFGKVDLNKLDKPAQSKFEHMRVYANSKLAKMMCSKELADRLQGTGVTVNCLHPGAVDTNINQGQSAVVKFFIPMITKFIGKTAKEGAQTSIHLAVSPELTNVTGKYFVDCKETATSNNVNDKTLAKQLWEFTEKLVGLKKEDEKKI